MKKLINSVVALILSTCFILGLSTESFALSKSFKSVMSTNKYRLSSNNFYLNALASSPSSIVNGTALTTWNTIDTSGCQDFVYGAESSVYGGTTYSYEYLKVINTNYVISYNIVNTKPVMWMKDAVDNPCTEYGLKVWPYLFTNQTINFSLVTNQPYLIANGSQVTYGSQYGYRLNTSVSSSIGTNACWYMV